MKTVRTSMSPKRAPVGEKGRRVARIDHFGASGKKSPDGTSLTVPSGRKVMRVVPRVKPRPLGDGVLFFGGGASVKRK